MSGGPTRPTVTRRTVLAAGAGAALTPLLRMPALRAQTMARASHGLSVFGDLKYGPDFTHFGYVNPEAPKGGSMAFTPPSWAYNQNPQTFDTLNSFVLKGNAPPRMELCFDTLMVRALDEPDAMYGLVAESVSVSEDGNTYTFALRPEARFHDGSPLTADDVAFSLALLKEKGHPSITQTIREMTGAKALDRTTVEVTFSGKQTRQLPLTVAALPILSKAYYETHDFTASTLDAPLSSGPYKVGAVDAGRSIEYERVADWWAKDLPVSRGIYNFDRLRIEFYRERDIAFEAFKKGNLTFREEFTSKTWATGYDFPAMRQGRVIKTSFPDLTPAGAQGWFFNTRRGKFSDPRTREAIGLAFDFEWTNQNLFYGLYERTNSFFQNSPMMATGTASADEMKLLELFRGQMPDAVFGEVWSAPVSDGSGRDRTLLRRASELLAEAGWVRQGNQLVSAAGRAVDDRDPRQFAKLRARRATFCQRARPSRHRGTIPARRRLAVPVAAQQFRFRHDRAALFYGGDAGRGHPRVLGKSLGRHGGQLQSRRHQEPGDRRADREGHPCAHARGHDGGRARARPGAQGRTLLGSQLVQGEPHGRLLGQVRPSGGDAGLRFSR